MTEITGTAGPIARALPRARKAALSKAGANADTAWRRWATKHRVVAAMLGGLVGVHFASVLGSWFGGFHLYRLDYSTGNGAVYLPKAAPAVQFVVGGLSHYADGVFFGLIFAVAVSPLLPLPTTRAGNLVKALIFGTILAVLALFVTAPYAFAPLRGIHDPLIALHLGWKYVISVLLFHWIYATQLGLIYSPLDEDPSAVPSAV